MPVPDSRDPRPAYEQIAADLRAAIKEGRLQPGDRLPTEREHAGRYGVAVGTYRQALAMLRREGWLATHRRHGTVVLRLEETPSPEYVDLSERLGQIEQHVSDLARQIEQIAGTPAPPETALAGRLAQIEAELARLGGQVDQLAHQAAGDDELSHDVTQMKKNLERLGKTARPAGADAGADHPGSATRR